MSRVKINQLLKTETPVENILIKGWVRTRRDTKTFSFLEINDGSCLKNLQVIVDDSLSNYGDTKQLTTGSAVAIHGNLIPSQGKGQTGKFTATASVDIISLAPDDYPLQKKRHTDEFLRTISHLRPRTNKYGAAFRIRSKLSYAIHRFFQERGFAYIHTPILTGSDCEGAGELFQVTALDLEKPPPVRRQDRLQPGFFWPARQSDGFRPTGSRNVRPGTGGCVYLRTHFPGGKFQYQPARR